MTYPFGKRIVIALGGSIVFPSEIDVVFIKKFKRLIEEQVGLGKQFVIVVGGGYLSRLYQKASREVANLSDRDKDWIGIHATRTNAQLLHAVFGKLAEPIVFDKRGKLKRLRYPITIGSGWQPGWSTDFVTSAIAGDLGMGEFVVAGKPDHVYNKDPHKYKNAEAFEHLTWKEYRRLVPAKWVPGASAPVDPVGARFAEKKKLKAIVIDGRKLGNFNRMLEGQSFEGTIIE
ncbi:MAG: Aspartate/glutamate/uridylate kinase [Parcubacteria group bacterium GW2011_GWA1_50_14]|uniref:UMP kinase n=1 Tax=Candidatus Colwellbacteria bacterium RIFCSPLOWO2_02_FULL_45_11 TaxID=1797692 RepID=A0A1G1ZAG8_9BACT|nr:MAG: Aspartate/glutamate/uridylate kinase [Parcubacteria group bacterium GW2011_GWA1_50_14]OGY61066.1 MAG: hypothetical protein A3I33_00355 [Candidatus Colwellbacteria bacterium RIFCSPLOWO2_02_FULL_45_11]